MFQNVFDSRVEKCSTFECLDFGLATFLSLLFTYAARIRVSNTFVSRVFMLLPQCRRNGLLKREESDIFLNLSPPFHIRTDLTQNLHQESNNSPDDIQADECASID